MNCQQEGQVRYLAWLTQDIRIDSMKMSNYGMRHEDPLLSSSFDSVNINLSVGTFTT